MADNTYHAVPETDSSKSIFSSKSFRRGLIVLSSLAIVAALTVAVVSFVPRGDKSSPSSSGSGSTTRPASSKFVLTHGSRDDTVRFEFITADGRHIAQSRDVSARGRNDMSKVLAHISATMQSGLHRGRVTISNLDGSYGFEVREASGQIVAFNVQAYLDAESLFADIQTLKAEAAAATLTIDTLVSSSKADLPSVVVEFTVDPMTRLWGFTLTLSGQVLFHQEGLYPSKAECIAALSDYLAYSNFLGNIAITDLHLDALPFVAREHWDVPNTPTRFHLGGKTGFEFNYAKIKSSNWNSGMANIMAWPETYWPTFNDGLAARWQSKSGQSDSRCTTDIDCLSPLEKYDLAFNNWRPKADFYKLKPYDAEQCGWNDAEVSKHWDPAYYTSRGPAATNNNGNDICHNGRDDSGNGMVDDCTKNGCEYYPAPYKQAQLARWFGLCHKWVPASLMEPEPQQSVTITTSDGIQVPFQISDIKGLSLSMEFISIFFGTRCNLNDEDIPRDQFGRIDHQVCRNTNAGAFHVVLANLLGREGRPFAMDRTWDAAVWNQPVVGFNTVSETPFSNAADACKWLGGCKGDGYNWNPSATSWVAVDVSVSWVAESYPSRQPRLPLVSYFTKQSEYQYLLELDNAGNIIGGEWKFGNPEHPDFLFLPYDLSPSIEDGFAHIDYSNLQDLIDKSMGTVHPPRSVKGTGFDITSTVATSTATVSENFAVFLTTVQLSFSGCPSSMTLDVKLSHGLAGVSNRVTVSNCQTASFKTFAFANMLGAGTWDIDVRSLDGTKAKLTSWELVVSDKPLHA